MGQPLWKTVWRIHGKHQIYHVTLQSHSWHISGKTRIQKDTCTPHVRSSTIYNSQDMKETPVSIKVNEEDVVGICGGILLSHEKGWMMSFVATRRNESQSNQVKQVRKRETNTI